ncbi:MAG TPA: hypothetical protein PKE04_21490, partial [Clostridia bacterium]|nr:hypothetical protein [Clostridia bacterium]
MFDAMLFLVLAFAALATLVECLVRGLTLAVRRHKRGPIGPQRVKRFQWTTVRLCLLIAVTAGWVAYTQAAAHTPALRDARGKVMEGSVARLERLELNGRSQWISIRAQDIDRPVLLFLAGGPGG